MFNKKFLSFLHFSSSKSKMEERTIFRVYFYPATRNRINNYLFTRNFSKFYSMIPNLILKLFVFFLFLFIIFVLSSDLKSHKTIFKNNNPRDHFFSNLSFNIHFNIYATKSYNAYHECSFKLKKNESYLLQ